MNAMTDNPDLQLGVEFFTKDVQNMAKSRESKRPIFDEIEMVRISFPGDKKTQHVAPANEMHYVQHARQQMTYAQRFSDAYAAFQDGRTDFQSGTPLIATGFVDSSKVAELKAQRIVTVEQLAGLTDTAIGRLGMGARALVEQAKEYLDKANGMAEIDALRAELAALKASQGQPTPQDDPFADYDDDDLKNMIKDAGGEVPRGNASRATLIARLQEMQKAAEDA